MTEVIKCDRCGKLEGEAAYQYDAYEASRIVIDMGHRKLHLCNTCTKAFMEWIKVATSRV